MSVREVLIYSQGIGRKPEFQERLAEEWQRDFGLEVIHRRPHRRGTNYKQHLQETSNILRGLSAPGTIVYGLGSCAGGMEIRSLVLRYPNLFAAAALINVTADIFDLTDEPELDEMLPSIRASSDTVQEYLREFGPEDPEQTIWLRSKTDEVIDRPRGDILPVDGHERGIEYALTEFAPFIIDSFRRRSGILSPNG